MSHFLMLFVSLLLLACSTQPSSSDKKAITELAKSRRPAQASVSKKTLFISKLQSPDEFDDLAEASTGVIRQGKTIKILIDNRNSQKPDVYFMNANYCPQTSCATPPPEAVFHYHFARKTLKGFAMGEADYIQSAYYTTTIQDRKFFDARIQRFRLTVNGQEQEYYGIRFIERDMITGELFQHAVTALQKVMNISKQNLAIILNSDHQKIDSLKPWLAAQGITTFTMEIILSGIPFIGLNPGTAYGFLRVFPKNEEDLEPYDIPVFDSLPLDLSVVAGTISTEYQDVGSHVNLKSKERGTPNMVARDPADVARLKSLDGKPVRLTVDYEKFTLEESTSQVVFQEYQKKINKPWTPVRQEVEKRLMHFDEMCNRYPDPAKCLSRSRAYGGKVAGLGFLAHPKVAGMGSPLQKKFGYRLSPMGFGVPLAFYNQFISEAMAKDPALSDAYTRLINGEMGLNGAQPLAAEERRELIAKLKAGILKAELPKDVYTKTYEEMLTLKKKVDGFYAGSNLEKLKIRSSSNAEDIEGFNGAGLHDSYSARVSRSSPNDFAGTDCKFVLGTDDDTGLTEEDVEPKSLACAMKASYASLWNLRAVRERSFKRFDHRTASMGLSVQTAYKFRKGPKIKANSVLLTRVLGTQSVYGMQISTQVKNGLVTNPVPNTKAELAVLGFDNSGKNVGISILQYAKPVASEPSLTSMILSREEMLKVLDIARDVEVKYCEAKKDSYFPNGNCSLVATSVRKKLALDMEFKMFDNNEILIKQVRTFSGR